MAVTNTKSSKDVYIQAVARINVALRGKVGFPGVSLISQSSSAFLKSCKLLALNEQLSGVPLPFRNRLPSLFPYPAIRRMGTSIGCPRTPFCCQRLMAPFASRLASSANYRLSLLR